MNALWEQLFPHVKQYMKAGDILRQRKDYRAGVEKLQNWLRSAEETLSSTQLTTAESVKLYGDELLKLQNEIEGIEELFKDISKKFQALIPDLSREEVDRMMNTLKKEKGGYGIYVTNHILRRRLDCLEINNNRRLLKFRPMTEIE